MTIRKPTLQPSKATTIRERAKQASRRRMLETVDRLAQAGAARTRLALVAAVPDQAVPDRAVPDRAVPDRAVPDRAVPVKAAAPRLVAAARVRLVPAARAAAVQAAGLQLVAADAADRAVDAAA